VCTILLAFTHMRTINGEPIPSSPLYSGSGGDGEDSGDDEDEADGRDAAWVALARVASRLISAASSVREAKEDLLSANLCAGAHPAVAGAWVSWALLACLLVACVALACIAAAVGDAETEAVLLALLVPLAVMASPYSDAGVRGAPWYASVDAWPLAVLMCAWHAHGFVASAGWGSDDGTAVAAAPAQDHDQERDGDDNENNNEGNGWEGGGTVVPAFGVLALCCVTLMHARFVHSSRFRTRVVAVLYAALVAFAPSIDSVVMRMPVWLAAVKVAAFFAVYALCSLAIASSEDPALSKNGKGAPAPGDAYASTDRVLVLSTWVLFTWRFLLVFALLQAGVYATHLVTNAIVINYRCNGTRRGRSRRNWTESSSTTIGPPAESTGQPPPPSPRDPELGLVGGGVNQLHFPLTPTMRSRVPSAPLHVPSMVPPHTPQRYALPHSPPSPFPHHPSVAPHYHQHHHTGAMALRQILPSAQPFPPARLLQGHQQHPLPAPFVHGPPLPAAPPPSYAPPVTNEQPPSPPLPPLLNESDAPPASHRHRRRGVFVPSLVNDDDSL
jgi:hypothetical protein